MWLLLDEGAARRGSARARGSARFRLQSAGRQPADHLGEVRGRQQESADRTHQRLARQQRLCDCRQALRLRRHRHRRARAPSSRCWSSTTAGVRLEPADGISRRDVPGDGSGAARRASAPSYRIASIGPAGEHLVRYATISHDGRHAGRGGSGAVLGAKNIKAIAVRGTQRARVGASARADRRSARSCRSGRSVRRPRSTASWARRPIC